MVKTRWMTRVAFFSFLLISLALIVLWIVARLDKPENAGAESGQPGHSAYSETRESETRESETRESETRESETQKGSLGKDASEGLGKTLTVEESLEHLASRNPTIRARALLRLSEAISKGEIRTVTGRMVEAFGHAMEVGEVEKSRPKEFGSDLDGIALTYAELPRSARLVALAKEKAFSPSTNVHARIACLWYLRQHDNAAFHQFLGEFVKGKQFEQLDVDLRTAFGGYEEISQLRDTYFAQLMQAFLQWQPKSENDSNPFRQAIKDEDPEIAGYISRTYPQKDAVLLPERIVSVLGEIYSDTSRSVLWIDFKNKPREVTAISFGSIMGGYPLRYGELTPEQLQYFNMWLYGDDWPQVQGMSQEELVQYTNQHLIEIKQKCVQRIKR